jgi:hypothetical protein
MNLPGKALAVGLIVWRESRLKDNRTVMLSQKKVGLAGIQRNAMRRALRNLEQAGLVSLGRKPGRSIEVTLLVIEN